MATFNLSYTASHIGIDTMFACVDSYEILRTVCVCLCSSYVEDFRYVSPAVHNYCDLKEI
jgi:hypothetical protein